mgnify:CR=1 FL=1
MARTHEYKVIEVYESGCSTVLLGASSMPLDQLESRLNREAADGWRLRFQVVERQRLWLFWARERVVCTLERPLG